MRSRKAAISLAGAILIILLVTLISVPRTTSAQTGQVVTVKQYSGNNIVGTWQNVNKGTVDGDTYVFTIPPMQREVRISGTYSVEVVR